MGPHKLDGLKDAKWYEEHYGICVVLKQEEHGEIVLWRNGGRYGSVERTRSNMHALSRELTLQLIQRDNTGTEHYEVIAPHPPPKPLVVHKP